MTPIQLWKWQMYISQNLRQSWYGNILGDEENDEDQDAMKVSGENFFDRFDSKNVSMFFSVQWSKRIRIF